MVISFVAFYMINNMQVPGKVENNIKIIDMQKAKPWELPLKSLAAFNTELAQFRCMGECAYVLNASSPFVWVWKTVRFVLDEAAR